MSTFLHYVHCKDALLDCSAPGGERCESLTWVDEINDDLSSTGPTGTNFSEIGIQIADFSVNNGLLNLHGINSCLIGKFMFNVYHRKVPHIFEGFFTQNHEIHDHNTRIASHFHIPCCSTNLSQTSIRFQGAIMWNKILKSDINPDCSEASFKQMLKKCVLQNIIN